MSQNWLRETHNQELVMTDKKILPLGNNDDRIDAT
jgi:hypothetical protein